jgi:hypothetical protein
VKEKALDVAKIVSDLKSERDRLGRAIEALEGMGPRQRAMKMTASVAAVSSATPGKKRGRLTAAGRKRLSEAMKRRWAERRKKG